MDNPDVPNLPEVGVRPFPPGHGLRFFNSHVFYLARPLDVSSLERATSNPAGNEVELIKLPAEAIADVAWTDEDDALATGSPHAPAG